VKVDLRVPVGCPLPEVADVIARAEDAGFDGVGVHDHPHSARDVYMALTLAAQRTRRLTLYPATSSPAVRHPVLLAAAAQSLEEIAPGRARLTIAPGFLSARSVGRPRAGVGAMREAIGQIRRLLAGEVESVGAGETRLRNLSPRPTPVFLLAAGPRMVELAGEVADGALLFVGLHRDAIAAARRHLAIGAQRAGRSLAGFPVIFIVTLGLAPTVAQGAEWIRRWFEPGRAPVRRGPGSDRDRRGPRAPRGGRVRLLRPARAVRRALAAREGGGGRRARVLLPGARPRRGLRDADGRDRRVRARHPPAVECVANAQPFFRKAGGRSPRTRVEKSSSGRGPLSPPPAAPKVSQKSLNCGVVDRRTVFLSIRSR
jgi:alkanesulfonate monooxygenase SsuD/methylene tetrahydromethanopterin reductase-like flavin-dependent oxidoreductase (luciferase family)